MTAWRVISVGDRVGAILFNDHRIVESPPSRSDKKVMGWLGDLASMNAALSVNSGIEANPDALLDALKAASRQVSHDYLVILVSDFHGWSDACLDVIRRIGQHNDIICSLVYDPLERDIAQAEKLVVSDGLYQLEINPADNALGERYEQQVQTTFARVRGDLMRFGIPIIPVHTARATAQQLREQLGGQRVLG